MIMIICFRTRPVIPVRPSDLNQRDSRVAY